LRKENILHKKVDEITGFDGIGKGQKSLANK
jgi:hypothetical protein